MELFTPSELSASVGTVHEREIGTSIGEPVTFKIRLVAIEPKTAVMFAEPGERACKRVLLGDARWTIIGEEDERLLWAVIICATVKESLRYARTVAVA